MPEQLADEGRRVPARERVYRRLRDEVMSGLVSPFEPLTEERVADRFAVSRTPVRDALTRLQADGLLVKHGSTLFVYTPNHVELTDLYELRVTLERRGVERAIEDPTVRHDPAVLEPELERWYAMREAPPEPDAGFVAHDEQFHLTLLRSSGNAQLVQVLAGVNSRIRSVRMHDYLTADRMEATIREHVEIAELVLSSRLPAALDALRQHVGASQQVVMSRAAQSLAMTRMAHQNQEIRP